MLHFKNY